MIPPGFQAGACVLPFSGCQQRVASVRVRHFLAASYPDLKHFLAHAQAPLSHLHTREAPGVATLKSFPSPLLFWALQSHFHGVLPSLFLSSTSRSVIGSQRNCVGLLLMLPHITTNIVAPNLTNELPDLSSSQKLNMSTIKLNSRWRQASGPSWCHCKGVYSDLSHF